MPFGDKSDLLHLESHSVYDYHRKGGTDMPADFKEKLAWETSWVDKVMAGDFDNLRYRATMLLKKNVRATIIAAQQESISNGPPEHSSQQP